MAHKNSGANSSSHFSWGAECTRNVGRVRSGAEIKKIALRGRARHYVLDRTDPGASPA
jgi:hypothetical protein